MSQQIDNKVVSMDFDNQKFERGISQSISSLDKLKASLDFSDAEESFKKVETQANDIDFKGLQKAIDTVNYRFSTMGIAGAAAITNITNTIMSAGKKAYSTTIGLIKSGGKQRALNLEQAKFQIEGLGKSWELLYEDMDYAVSGTAYGLDSAAKAASQLAASNVAAGDEMKAALRGISGLAAMTSSEYDDIANIFTTVAGNGRLMSEQLLQLSSRGLNAAAALATQLGTTEAEIREMVSDGEIDFNTFASAMDSAFGEHAKAANKTFTGAMSNVKAALSRIGADFYITQLDNARQILVKLIDVVNGLRKVLSPFITILNDGLTRATKAVTKFLDSFDFSVWYAYADRANLFFKTTDQIAETAETATESLETLKNVVTAVMRGNYGNGQARKDALAEAGYDYDQIQGAVNAVILQGKTLDEALSETSDSISDSSESASTSVEKSVEDILAEIDEYNAKIEETKKNRLSLEKTLTQQEEALTAAQATGVEATIEEAQKAYDATETLIEQADSEIEDYQDHIEQLGKKDQVEKLEEALNRLSSAAKNVSKSGFNVIKIFKSLKDQAGDALDQVFPNRDLSKPILKLSQALLKLSSNGLLKVKNNASKFQSTFKGAFSIISIGVKTIKALLNALSPLTKIFETTAGGALTVSSSAGEAIYQFDQWLDSTDALTKAFTPLKKGLEVVSNVLSSFIGSVKNGFTGQIEKSDKLVTKLGQHVGTFSKKISNFFSTLLKNTSESDTILNGIKKTASQTFPIIQNGISKVGSVTKSLKIPDFLEKVKEGISDLIETISGFFGKGGNEAEDGLVTIKDEASATSASIRETTSAFDNFANSVGSRLDSVKEGLNSFKEKLEDVFGSKFQINDGGDIIDVTKMGIALAILYKIQQATKTLWESSPSELIRNTSNAVSQLRSTLVTYQNELKAKMILDVAKATIFLAGAMLIVSMIPSDKLLPAAIAITAVTAALAFAVSRLAVATTAAEGVGIKLGGLIAIFVGLGTAIAAIGIGFAGIGIGLAALTGAIVALYKVIEMYAGMDTAIWEAGFEKIKMVISALGEFLARSFLNGIGGKKGGIGVAIKLLAIVAALYLLQHVLKDYANLDANVFELGMERITAILTKLTSVMVTTTLTGLASFGGLGLIGFASILFGFVALLKAIMTPIKALAEMDTDDIDKATKALNTIINSLGVFLVSMIFMGILAKRVGGMKTRDILGLAGIMLAAASMISIVTGAIKTLGTMDQATLTQGFGVLTASLILVAGFAAAVNMSMKGVDATHSGGLKGLSALTSVILAIVAAVVVLGNMPGEVLLKGVISLFLALGALALVVQGVGTSLVASQNTWTAILAFSALLLAIAGSLYILSQLKFAKMMGAILGLGIVLTVLSGFVLIFNASAMNMNNTKGMILTMLAVILSLAAVTAAIAILAQFPAGKVVAAGTMISLVLITIAGIILLLGKTGGPGAIAAAASAALSIVVFVGILLTVMAAIGGLSMGLEKLTKGVSIADLVGSFMDIIVKIAEGLGKAREAVFGKAKEATSIIEFINSVKSMMAAAKDVGDLGDLASVFIAIAGGFAAANFSGIFETINQAFGGESTIDRLEEFIDTMKTMLTDLNGFVVEGSIDTNAIKNVAEAINLLANVDISKTGGIAQAFTGSYDYSGFIAFVDGISPALFKLQATALALNMNPEPIESAIKMINKLANIDVPKSGANLFDGLITWGATDWEGFNTFVDNIGPALQSLSKFASGYTTYISGSTVQTFQEGMDFEALGQAIKAISKLAQIDIPDSSLLSHTDFSGFTSFIYDIGPALATMSEALTYMDTINYGSGLSVDVEKSLNIEAIKGAIDVMSEMAKIELPKDNGLLGVIMGDEASTFDSFAKALPNVGNGLADLSSALKEGSFDEDSVRQALRAFSTLASIDAKEVDGSNLKGLATAMKSLGPALYNLYSQVGKDNTHGVTYGSDSFTGFIDAMSSLSTITNLGQLKALGNGLQAIVDSGIGSYTYSLGDFTTNMETIAAGLKAYSNSITGISMSKIADSADGLNAFSSVDFSGSKDMSKFGSNLTDLSTGVTDFIEAIDTASISIALGGVNNILGMIDDIESAHIDAIDDFGAALGTVGEVGVTAFIEAFTSESSKTGARNALQVFVDAADDNITLTNITNAGKNVAQGFIDGMKSEEKLQAAYNAGVALANKAEEGAKSKKGADEHSPSKKFQKIGAYCVEGFVNALGNTTDAYNKGAALGLAALAGTNAALDIHSPSRKMYLSGKYAVDGLVKALSNGNAKVKLTGDMLGKTLADTGKRSGEKVLKEAETTAKRVKQVTNTLVKNVMRSMKTTKQVKKYAGEAVKAYVKAHGVSAKKASKAIGSMVENWYKGTDQYATDKQNIKSNVKSLRQLLKQREETVADHEKELKKLRKNGASKKEINKTIKEQQKELKQIDDAIAAAQKSIAQSEADMAANIEAIWESATSVISDNLSNFLDILEVDFDAGIDLLSEFTSAYASTMSTLFSDYSGDDTAENYKESKEELEKQISAKKAELEYWKKMDEAVDHHSATYRDNIKSCTKELEELEKEMSELKTPQEEMLKAMSSNVEGISEWRDNLAKLRAAYNAGIISSDMYEYLVDLGLEGADTVQTFAEMTNDELSLANGYWLAYAKAASESMDDILDDMKKNNDETIEYQNSIAKLRAMGLSEGIIESLEALGTEGLPKIKAFLSATGEQIAQANAEYGRSVSANATEMINNAKEKMTEVVEWQANITALKGRLSATGLDENTIAAIMGDVLNKGVDYNDALETILGMDDAQLAEYMNNVGAALTIPETVAQQTLSQFTDIGDKAGQTFYNHLTGNTDGAGTDLITGTADAANSAADTDSSEDDEEGGGTKKAGRTMAKSFAKGIINVLKKYGDPQTKQGKKMRKAARSIGRNIVQGVKKGIENNAPQAEEAVNNLGDGVINALKTRLGIASPSKEFAILGEFADMGLAQGLRRYAALASEEATAVGDETVDALATAMSYLPDAASMEDNPVIAPVVDLSDVRAKAEQMNYLLSQRQVAAIEAQNYESSIRARRQALAEIQNGLSGERQNIDQSTQTNNYNIYVTGNNPREIAQEVSRVIQEQVDRRQSVWA